MQNMTAAEMGRAIGAGTLDPVDLAHAYFAAIEAHPLSDRIYARLTKIAPWPKPTPRVNVQPVGIVRRHWMAFQ